MPTLVEGYGMFIWENEDGTVTYTGSFNASDWNTYTKSKRKFEVAEGTTVPDAGDTASAGPADLVEQPAGNASLDDWRAYALTQGATEDDLEGLSRNDLRDKYKED